MVGAEKGYSAGNFKDNLYDKPSYTVPSAPSRLPDQENKLSPSGNAVMALLPDIISFINSDCNLLVTPALAFLPAGGALPLLFCVCVDMIVARVFFRKRT